MGKFQGGGLFGGAAWRRNLVLGGGENGVKSRGNAKLLF